MTSVGDRIRTLRRQKDLSQDAVADQVGVTPAYVSKIENGRSSPDVELLEKFAKALGVSPRDLLPMEGPEDESLAVFSQSLPVEVSIPMGAGEIGVGDKDVRRSTTMEVPLSEAFWLELSEPLCRALFPFIKPGDRALLSHTERVRPGDLVAARWPGSDGGLFFYSESNGYAVLSGVGAASPVVLQRDLVTKFRVLCLRKG